MGASCARGPALMDAAILWEDMARTEGGGWLDEEGSPLRRQGGMPGWDASPQAGKVAGWGGGCGEGWGVMPRQGSAARDVCRRS